MTKFRVFVFLSTLLIVGILGTYVSYYARGYRLDLKTLKFLPNGILVIKSEPDGASVYINGDLKTATNANISLAPGVYDVEVKKEGYSSWSKRLTIEKEVVTQAGVSLFKNLPALSPATTNGASNPIISDDNSKIAYTDKTGLWVIDVANLPLGFGRDPRKITDGNLTNATYEFSPDASQILLTISNSIFILDAGTFTPQAQRINIASSISTIRSDWEAIRQTRNESLLKNLPGILADIFINRTTSLTFSPDESMILYEASASATLPENLVKQLPGASTQRQERTIEEGKTYVYDIKEDRNFFITEGKTLSDRDIKPYWMPGSRHLLLAENGKITIMDYDGTNRQAVYSGSYIAPFAYPFSNSSKLLILTNLGSDSGTPNLYSLTIK